jgi:hypothetical protein
MNQTQQFAPSVICKSDKALEIARQTFDCLVKIVRTIGKPMERLEELFSFDGTAVPNAAPGDRPEANDGHVYQTIPTMHERISSYAELQKLIHDALRIQHPEWIGLDGQSEMCEFYEARFATLLGREKPVTKN